MLDSILNMVKNEAMQVITNNSAIPEGKKAETVETTTHAIASGLQQNLNLSNLSGLSGLLGGGGSSSLANNPMVSSIQNTVVNALVQKVGLSQGIASTIASTVMSSVVNALSKRVNDPNDKGFNLESIVGAFTGGNKSVGSTTQSSSGGDILGSLGKLFGK